MERIQEFFDDITGPWTKSLTSVNDWVYLWIIIAILVGTGLYLTVRTGAVQIRHFGSMISALTSSRKGAEGGISSFQAFTMGMATRIGIGNITGVALAMILGGPGALFWMWLVALIGMSTAFAEATLAQIFKQRHGDGTFRGGPATYILHGLGSRPLAVAFAVCMIFSMVIAMPMVQSNTIAGVLSYSHNVPAWVTAVIVAIATALVLIGGVRTVAKATEIIAPLMALAYLITAIAVVALHIDQVPAFFSQVFQSAFGMNEALAGTAGGILAAILNGVRRGLFSNEAGMGTNPNAAATATVAHPVQQGFVQSFGVFLDTMVVCTATGFIILTSGVLDLQTAVAADADHITTAAITQTLGGWMAIPVSVMIFFFGFSSTVGAFAYAEANIVFLGLNKSWDLVARTCSVVFSAIGAMLALPFVWTLMDSAMAIVTALNLIGVIALASWVKAALVDYEKNPTAQFDPARAGLPGRLPTNAWSHTETDI